MDKRNKSEKGKVLPFPNLEQRLLEKGMDALKRKVYEEAILLFHQLLEVNATHPQGNFGLMLAHIEAGDLQKGKESAEHMLHSGVGDYYEVLHVYLSILVQLGDYEAVKTTLEGVLQEGKVPTQYAESFYQMLSFSRQMVKNKPEQEPLYDDGSMKESLEGLHSESFAKQLQAIEALHQFEPEAIIPALREFFIDDTKDPLLKSLALQTLKEKDVQETMTVRKWGTAYDVVPKEIHDIIESDFTLAVKALLTETIEQNNPTLYQQAVHLWWHYCFVIYPVPLKPKNHHAWAAAVHLTTAELNGVDFDQQTAANTYRTDEHDLEIAVKQLKKVESYPFPDQ